MISLIFNNVVCIRWKICSFFFVIPSCFSLFLCFCLLCFSFSVTVSAALYLCLCLSLSLSVSVSLSSTPPPHSPPMSISFHSQTLPLNTVSEMAGSLFTQCNHALMMMMASRWHTWRFWVSTPSEKAENEKNTRITQKGGAAMGLSLVRQKGESDLNSSVISRSGGAFELV